MPLLLNLIVAKLCPNLFGNQLLKHWPSPFEYYTVFLPFRRLIFWHQLLFDFSAARPRATYFKWWQLLVSVLIPKVIAA
jgi:hypothetical protein